MKKKKNIVFSLRTKVEVFGLVLCFLLVGFSNVFANTVTITDTGISDDSGELLNFTSNLGTFDNISIGGVREINGSYDNLDTMIHNSKGNIWEVDGVDDDVQIQQAIWDLNSSGGGIVYLPEGTFVITSSILLTNKTTLQGKGVVTILQRSGNWNGDIIKNMHNTEYIDNNITVSDLYIDDAPTGTTFPCGVCIYRANNILIERVYINGSEAHGIELYGCENGTVRDCIVTNTADDAFQSDSTVARPAKHQLWENCVAYFPGQMGIKLENQGHMDITIRDCTIFSPTTNGIGGISTTGEYRNIVIENNWIYDATEQSIIFKDLKSGKIVNNWIISPQHQGILVEGNTYNTDTCYGFSIEGNHIIDGANYGIYLIKCKNFKVVSNYIEDCTTNMIAIYESTNGTIADNVINASATTGIKLFDGGVNGTNDNVVSGNILNRLTNGITEANTGNYNSIENNNVRGCTNKISTVGSNTIVRNNLGHETIFPTSNVSSAQTGYAYISGDGLLIKTSGGWVNLTAGGGSGGNPFDQDLNKSDAPVFANATFTNNITIDGRTITSSNITGWDSVSAGNPFNQSLNTTDKPTFDDLTTTDDINLGDAIIIGNDGSILYNPANFLNFSTSRSGTWFFYANNKEFLEIIGSSGVVVNPDGESAVDFTVKGDNSDVIFVDAGGDNVTLKNPSADNITIGGKLIDGSNITSWDTCYGWGDHSVQNYFDTDTMTTDDLTNGSWSRLFTTANRTVLETVYGWGNDFNYSGYNQDLNSTDGPTFANVTIDGYTIEGTNISAWDAGGGTADDLSDNDTDDLSEGSSNFYATLARIRSLVSGQWLNLNNITVSNNISIGGKIIDSSNITTWDSVSSYDNGSGLNLTGSTFSINHSIWGTNLSWDGSQVSASVIGAVDGYFLNGTIQNSNGNSWTATGSNIQLAIWDLNGTGGTVWLPGGTTISVSNTITIPCDITLDLGNCIITNGADVDLFKMYQDSKLVNGRIEATGAFTSDVINVTETFSFTNFTLVENIHITGDVGTGNGNAIHLYSSTTDCCISNFQLQNAYIRGFENSILLTTYDNTWISANMFDNIWIDAPVYGIRLLSYGTDNPHSNIFSNIVIQSNAVTVCGVTFTEYRNYFQGHIHDWVGAYNEDNSRFAIQLAGGKHYVDVYVDLNDAQAINDTGYGNTIINRAVTNGSRITKMAWVYKFGRISDNFIHPDSTTCGIQEAIDDLELAYDDISPSDGGIVFIPKGTYNITTTIVTKLNGLTLQGVPGQTIIRLADDTDSDVNMISVSSGTNNVTIRDLIIDGNADGQSTGNCRGIHMYKCDNVLIDNVIIHDIRTWHGIRFDQCNMTTVSNCYVYDCPYIISTNIPELAVITNNYFHGGIINGLGAEYIFTDNQIGSGVTFQNTNQGCLLKNNIGYNNNSLFPYYAQASAPSVADNSTVWWYDSSNVLMKILVNTYGNTFTFNSTDQSLCTSDDVEFENVTVDDKIIMEGGGTTWNIYVNASGVLKWEMS